MKKMILGMGIAVAALSVGAPAADANQPDSVYIFSYANANGEGGLRLAWSADGTSWQKLNNGNSVVNSDFGPWGRMKKMFHPSLAQTADGTWVATWELSPEGKGWARVESPDLIRWGAQTYTDAAPASVASKATPLKARVGSKARDGMVQKVPYSLVEALRRYGDHRAYRDALHAQTMAGDAVRFASLKPLKGALTVYPDSTKAISPNLMGIFFEDINYAADGGLYAELIQNRDFEYNSKDRSKWSATTSWHTDDAAGRPVIATADPIHPNNPHYAVLKGQTLSNSGFDGIPLKKGEKYDLSLRSRLGAGAKALKLRVELRDTLGNVLASATLSPRGKGWKEYKTTLTPSESTSCGRLVLIPSAPDELHLDMISLFPRNTFKGRLNGLRADLAQTLADLHPRFVRFPGGCVAHGDGVDNIYDWKGSIGPLEARKPLSNLWGYHQTRGLGYHEYFLFCEDIGAEPLPVVAAGVPCQNSGDASHHSHTFTASYGQQCGIPMEEMDAYVQDVLDLIEYANGDARTTRWGRLRAEAGHPEPFNLKYIGIGNEDMITPVFTERFNKIYDAVGAAHPEVKVIGTVGPFYEGTDYELGWQLATEKGVPMVDEHYYVQPGWMIHNQDYYDSYDRSKPHVYLGEWAAHLDGRPSNVETALAEALYLTAVERNADVVEMASYAPLLAKDGHTQWRPDLIYFSNTEVRPTVDYHVQQLYGANSGTTYVNSAVSYEGGDPGADATRRVGVSIVRTPGGDTVVKLANLLPFEVQLDTDFASTLGFTPSAISRTTLTGTPAQTDAHPEVTALDAVPAQIVLPPYSFTVLRFSK